MCFLIKVVIASININSHFLLDKVVNNSILDSDDHDDDDDDDDRKYGDDDVDVDNNGDGVYYDDVDEK